MRHFDQESNLLVSKRAYPHSDPLRQMHRVYCEANGVDLSGIDEDDGMGLSVDGDTAEEHRDLPRPPCPWREMYRTEQERLDADEVYWRLEAGPASVEDMPGEVDNLAKVRDALINRACRVRLEE